MKIISIDEFEDLFESESLIFKNICDNNNIKFSSDICKYKIPRTRTNLHLLSMNDNWGKTVKSCIENGFAKCTFN